MTLLIYLIPLVIPWSWENVKSTVYYNADDLILLSESEHGLQRCLDKLSCYAKKWQMRINIKKTKAIIFNKSGKIFRSEFKLGNQPIQVTDSYVYLGITFSPSGSFSLAQKKLYNNATRSLYSFLSEINIYNGASVSTCWRTLLGVLAGSNNKQQDRQVLVQWLSLILQ